MIRITRYEKHGLGTAVSVYVVGRKFPPAPVYVEIVVQFGSAAGAVFVVAYMFSAGFGILVAFAER
jgi:hypothetical protein